MSKTLPWFRMYSEAVDDEKLRLLAFEDRWHFVALLCCKAKGILDEEGDIVRRKIAVKLGLDMRSLEEAARRLAEVGLIEEKTLQPIAWDERQFRSDSSTERVRAYRERAKRHGNVSETAQDTDTDTDTEKETEEEKHTHSATRSEAKAEKPKRGAVAPVARPEGVDESVWADFIALRKAKRAAMTQTALNSFVREAEKAGMTLQAVLEMCCAKGWQGFEASWVAPKPGQQGAGPIVAHPRSGNGGMQIAGLRGVI